MNIPRAMKLLADETRLRLLTLLEQEELSVQELTDITGMGQSRVSRHLGLLREAGAVEDRKEGTWTFYKFRPPTNGAPFPREVWSSIGRAYSGSTEAQSDRHELERIREARRERSRAAHDRLAGVWQQLVGEQLERGSLRSEALAAVASPRLKVADLGCGAGFFSSFLAPRTANVIAVDHSAAMLEHAREQCPDQSVEFRQGELDALPIADGEVDAVFANLVMHHVPEFAPVASEIERILKPGGVAVISDLLPHNEDWMREAMGDPRLGIEPEELASPFREGAFETVEILPSEDRYRLKSPGGRLARLELFLLRAVKRAD